MPNKIPLYETSGVISELFDSDDEVKKQFQENVSAQVVEFAEEYSKLFATFENFLKDCSYSMQASLVAGLMHGVLDDSLTAAKLLLTGKLGPSGNLIRQATEGLCMTILCAQPGTLSIGNKEQIYWSLLKANDKAVQGQHAPSQLLKNIDRLGLNDAGVEQIRRAVEVHHGHSHAGLLTMALRMDLRENGQIHFGGHFDPEKLEGYRAELTQLKAVAKWAIETLSNLWPKIKLIPRDRV